MAEKLFSLVVCSALIGVLAACGPTVGSTPGVALVITPGMKGQSVSLKVGDTFEIQIPTIPTAGYKWETQDLQTTMLLQLGDPVFTADSGSTGAGGIVTLKFKVVGTGTTTLNLIYASPSENGVPSLYSDSFGVTIEVK